MTPYCYCSSTFGLGVDSSESLFAACFSGMQEALSDVPARFPRSSRRLLSFLPVPGLFSELPVRLCKSGPANYGSCVRKCGSESSCVRVISETLAQSSSGVEKLLEALLILWPEYCLGAVVANMANVGNVLSSFGAVSLRRCDKMCRRYSKES